METMLLLKFSFLLYCINFRLKEIDWIENILLLGSICKDECKIAWTIFSHFTEEEENKLFDAEVIINYNDK